MKCPHCAETIKNEALICRYCGRKVGDQASNDNWIVVGAVVILLVVLALLGFLLWRHFRPQITQVAKEVTEEKIYCRDSDGASQKIVVETQAAAATGCKISVKDSKSGQQIMKGALIPDMVGSIAALDKSYNNIQLEPDGVGKECQTYIVIGAETKTFDAAAVLDRGLQSIALKPCDRVAYILARSTDGGGVITSEAEVVVAPITWRIMRASVGETPQYVFDGPAKELGSSPAAIVGGLAERWPRSESVNAASLPLKDVETHNNVSASSVALDALSGISSVIDDKTTVWLAIEGSVVNYKNSLTLTETEYKKRVNRDNANSNARCTQLKAADPLVRCSYTYPITNSYLQYVTKGFGRLSCNGAKIVFVDGEESVSQDYGAQKAAIYKNFLSQCITK